MRTSVVVIAHNEEAWIGNCLESLMKQSQKPNEIIVVVHNCTDSTKQIAEKFPVKIIECFEEGASIISRARGIEATTGEIVCCTDGDCWVDKCWIKNITKPLFNKDISIVGGYTKIQNSFFWKFSCWWQFVWNRKIRNKRSHRFAWGSNFAFRKSDYDKVGGLIPFLEIQKTLKLNYYPDDLYISLALQKVGKIFWATGARVYTYMPPEKASISAQKIIVPKQQEDNQKLFTFFKV